MSSMVTCPRGHQWREDASYCPECGLEISNDQPSVTEAASRQTNGFAVAALVCGLLLNPITMVLAIAFGVVALKQIRASGEGGRGLARAGLILGVIELSVVVMALVAVLVYLIFFMHCQQISTYYSQCS